MLAQAFKLSSLSARTFKLSHITGSSFSSLLASFQANLTLAQLGFAWLGLKARELAWLV